MTPRRRTACAAGTLVALLAVAGCGGDDTPADAPGTSAPATPATPADPGTADPTPAAPTGQPEPITAAELDAVLATALDPDLGADLVVENDLGFLDGEGTIDLRAVPSSLALTLTSSETGEDQRLETRVVDGRLYVRDAEGWLVIDLDSPDNPFGTSLGDQLDPRAVLDRVRESLVGATRQGTVEQDGEQLEVYRATTDGPAFVEAIAPELADRTDAAVPAQVTCDIGVDDEGRARSVVVDLGEQTGSLTYTFVDWREDVSITAPPADQVSELDLPG